MIKKMSRKIPNFVQLFVLLLLTFYYLWQHLNLRAPIFDMLRELLPALLIVIAVVVLVARKKLFAGHTVLFITAYMNPGKAAIMTLLGFNFQTMEFNNEIVLSTVIYAVIFIYMILMILSYLLNDSLSNSNHKGKVVALILASLIFINFANNIGISFFFALALFASLAFGAQVSSLLIVLAILIDLPFQIIDYIMNSSLLDQSLGYFIFSFIGLVLIFVNIKYLFKYKS
ncbi:MAG: hypothetical protein WC154_05970 [Candidatus Izemoplasmatales bacterium]